MTQTTLRTRKTAISRRKQAFEGDAYEQTWVGLRAVYTTYEGKRLVGTITKFVGGYPIVEFGDGRWGRLELHVEIVED